jgi:hypothetical protein
MPDKSFCSPLVAKMMSDANLPLEGGRTEWVEIPPDPEELRRTRIVGRIQELMADAPEHSPLWEVLSSAEDHAWAYVRAYQDQIGKEASDG